MGVAPNGIELHRSSGSPGFNSLQPVTMFGDMLRRDRERWGLTFSQAAWRFAVSASEYHELEAGTRWPSFDTYNRICELFGWQTFAGARQGRV
jgi:hypothetical protein